MDVDDDDASPTKKAKKVVQRDLLGRAITKKKEEKAWAPGMSEGWSNDDEDMSDGEPEDDDDGATRAKKRKATASGSRKRQKKSGPLGTTSKTAARQRWKEQHPDHTPFELEMYEMCDSAFAMRHAFPNGNANAKCLAARCFALLRSLAQLPYDVAPSDERPHCVG